MILGFWPQQEKINPSRWQHLYTKYLDRYTKKKEDENVWNRCEIFFHLHQCFFVFCLVTWLLKMIPILFEMFFIWTQIKINVFFKENIFNMSLKINFQSSQKHWCACEEFDYDQQWTQVVCTKNTGSFDNNRNFTDLSITKNAISIYRVNLNINTYLNIPRNQYTVWQQLCTDNIMPFITLYIYYKYV